MFPHEMGKQVMCLKVAIEMLHLVIVVENWRNFVGELTCRDQCPSFSVQRRPLRLQGYCLGQGHCGKVASKAECVILVR